MTRSHEAAQAPSHNILKKFGFLFSAHGVRELFQTVFLISLARMYPTTYGQFTLALSVGQIMRFVSECGLNQHLMTMIARKDDYPTSLITQFLTLKGAILSLAWVVMLGFTHWQEYDATLRTLVIIISTGVALEALTSSFFVVYQLLGRQDIEGKVRSVGAATGFGYGLVMLFSGASPILISFYKIIETLVTLAGAAVLIYKKITFTFNKEQLLRVWDTWKKGIVFTLMAAVSIFYNKINMFFLQSATGSHDVAQYGVTWGLVEGICSMVSAMLLGKVMFPIFAKLFVKSRKEFTALAQDSVRWLLAAATIIMFVLGVESDRLIPLIYGDSYSDAIWMQKYLVFAIALHFIHNLAVYLMISAQRQLIVLIIFSIGLLFNLAVCMTLIPKWPLLGTALAIVLTKGFVALMSVSFCQLRFRMLPFASIAQLLLAIALGAGLYYVGTEYLFREAGEILALGPVAYLAWGWRKELNARKEQVDAIDDDPEGTASS